MLIIKEVLIMKRNITVKSEADLSGILTAAIDDEPICMMFPDGRIAAISDDGGKLVIKCMGMEKAFAYPDRGGMRAYLVSILDDACKGGLGPNGHYVYRIADTEDAVSIEDMISAMIGGGKLGDPLSIIDVILPDGSVIELSFDKATNTITVWIDGYPVRIRMTKGKSLKAAILEAILKAAALLAKEKRERLATLRRIQQEQEFAANHRREQDRKREAYKRAVESLKDPWASGPELGMI